MTPEAAMKVAAIRAKQDRGEATEDDLREFIKLLRDGRQAALASSETAKRKTAKAVIPNAEDLLNELLG